MCLACCIACLCSLQGRTIRVNEALPPGDRGGGGGGGYRGSGGNYRGGGGGGRFQIMVPANSALLLGCLVTCLVSPWHADTALAHVRIQQNLDMACFLHTCSSAWRPLVTVMQSICQSMIVAVFDEIVVEAAQPNSTGNKLVACFGTLCNKVFLNLLLEAWIKQVCIRSEVPAAVPAQVGMVAAVAVMAEVSVTDASAEASPYCTPVWLCNSPSNCLILGPCAG